MLIDGITVNAQATNSCWGKYANDCLQRDGDNVRCVVLEGVVWLVPLQNVAIKRGQELYFAYDGTYWFTHWAKWDADLRHLVLERSGHPNRNLPGTEDDPYTLEAPSIDHDVMAPVGDSESSSDESTHDGPTPSALTWHHPRSARFLKCGSSGRFGSRFPARASRRGTLYQR